MNKTSLKGKIVVIGAGNVGSTIAYTIMMNNLVSEIVIIDVNKEKAQGEALDMNHGIAYFKQISIKSGDYSDCEDADVIIITAGIARKPGQTRLELAKINVSIGKDITKNIMAYAKNPIILVISNPVDILTYVIQKESGLPANRVIGSGTTLDTARLRYLLSAHCDIDVRNVHAYIIGEHGDSEVAVWSRANIAGKPFDEFCDDCPKQCKTVNRDQILKDTITSGAEIIRLKGATYYGIGMAATRIVAAIINDEKAVLTVSSVLNGDYNMNDVALSLPCVVSSEGIERYINIRMSEKEVHDLQQSANKIKEAIKEINA
jgi:L-lactate dehydrogenase